MRAMTYRDPREAGNLIRSIYARQQIPWTAAATAALYARALRSPPHAGEMRRAVRDGLGHEAEAVLHYATVHWLGERAARRVEDELIDALKMLPSISDLVYRAAPQQRGNHHAENRDH